jgi:hypothetical protein
LDTGPLKTIYNLGDMLIYAGARPANADAAVRAATLFSVVTNSATATG